MVETNRRNFVRGLAGLFALTVVPGTAQAVIEDDHERFMRMAASGVVRDQTFYIPDGRSISLVGVRDLAIEDCRFVWPKGSAPIRGHEGGFMITDESQRVALRRVTIENFPGYAVYVESVRDVDLNVLAVNCGASDYVQVDPYDIEPSGFVKAAVA